MFGVILLTQPQMIFPSLASDIPASPDQTSGIILDRTSIDYYIGIFFALFGSISGSFVFVVCRKLGTQIHVSIHPFFMATISGLGGVLLLAFSRY